MSKKALYFLVALSIAALLASCSSSKYKSTEKEKTQTEATLNTQTAAVKNNDSSHLQQNDSSYHNESGFSINFENESTDNSSVSGSDLPIAEKENDYAGAPLKPKPTVQNSLTRNYRYQVDNKIITSPVPIKNINFFDKTSGKTTAIELTRETKQDSTGATTAVTAKESSSHEIDIKDKKTTSYWWILLIIIAAAAAFFIYRLPVVQAFLKPFFALFKKKKQDPGNS